MSIRIAPSLLAADFSRLREELAEVEAAGADLLHLDIMDGHFVPNLTFGPMVIDSLAPHASVPLDAHLMVADADRWLRPLADADVARVAVHVEACPHLHRSLATIRELGMTPGVAINPATPATSLSEALSWADFVLVMTVNPGFGGQAFIPEMIAKITRIAAMSGGRETEIAVDGGVDSDTAPALVAAGATTLIAGSSVFGARDRAAAVAALRTAAAQGASS